MALFFPVHFDPQRSSTVENSNIPSMKVVSISASIKTVFIVFHPNTREWGIIANIPHIMSTEDALALMSDGNRLPISRSRLKDVRAPGLCKQRRRKPACQKRR